MKHKREIETYYPNKMKKCITCSNKFRPTNAVQKYCKPQCSPFYKEHKPRLDLMFCSNCKRKFYTTRNQTKYCKRCRSYRFRVNYKKWNGFTTDKYPIGLIIENIRRFYNNEELTMSINIFRKHPLVKEILFSDKQKPRYKCNHLARKIIIPKGQLCEECKMKEAKVRHHPDYSQPLFIRFLCYSCHIRLHKSKEEKVIEL